MATWVVVLWLSVYMFVRRDHKDNVLLLFYLEELASFWPRRMFFFFFHCKKVANIDKDQISRYTIPAVMSLGKYQEQSNEHVNYMFELKQLDKMEPARHHYNLTIIFIGSGFCWQLPMTQTSLCWSQ